MNADRRFRSAFIAAPLLAAFFAVSCWVPPYDPAISASAYFEKKLEHVASIGPLSFQGLDSGTDYFVPSFEAAPTDGYWVRRSNGTNIAVRYVSVGSAGTHASPAFFRNPNYFGDLNAVASLGTGAAAVSVSDIGKGLILLGSGTVTGASANDSILGTGATSGSAWGAGIQATVSTPPPNIAFPVGGARRYSASTAIESGLLFEVFSSPSAFSLYYCGAFSQDLTSTYASTAPVLSFDYPISYPGPILEAGAFFVQCSTHYILSGKSGADGSPVGYRWTSLLAAPTAVSFDAQITDALQDDTLVARGPEVTKYYSSEGARLFELPTGALRYVHEYDDGGVWYSYFTRTACVNASDGSGQVRFDVFRYPSAALSALAN
jgi:hypothetical protein